MPYRSLHSTFLKYLAIWVSMFGFFGFGFIATMYYQSGRLRYFFIVLILWAIANFIFVALNTRFRAYLAPFARRFFLVVMLLLVADIGYLGYRRISPKVSKIFSQVFKKAPAPDTPIVPVYKFSQADGNPAAFLRWWKYYVGEWNKPEAKEAIEIPTPDLPVPFVFRKNSVAKFMDAEYRINSYGFSDKEFNPVKGDKYRIVTVGSSHTQGPIMYQGDWPWPQMLENIIGDRLQCEKEVEVLNSAAEAHDIKELLWRYSNLVVPLDPDIVVTYIGWNGYKHYFYDFPKIKPIKHGSILLSKLVNRWGDYLVVNGVSFGKIDTHRVKERMHDSIYGRAYGEYIRIAKDNNFKLVIANFNIAVNASSPQKVVDFYKIGFPDIENRIKANEINSKLVASLHEPEEKIIYIDVQKELHGAYEEYYLDPVHLTNTGKHKLAQNMFEGIRATLEADMNGVPK